MTENVTVNGKLSQRFEGRLNKRIHCLLIQCEALNGAPLDLSFITESLAIKNWNSRKAHEVLRKWDDLQAAFG
jgi:hypothetical protein